ncbi:D-alanyl-D-alanine carboxypeptidase/D-alanyl-D-alanine-endopeptidase [Alphaproteobacteria bacterium]|nr:D-alanyl-D-alanine carboxypeptidase/D-alanyl-D-alanine-endopeptidase [Alphaproteobacteria bacterium]
MNLLLVLIFFFCQSAISSVSPSVGKTIDSMLKKENPHLMVGIEIRDLPSGKIIYEKNANSLIKPASLQKISSGLVALLQLGPHYRFKTSLFEKEGVAYLDFSGDPTLSLGDIERLFHLFKKKKGEHISKNIIVYEKNVPLFFHGEGWSVESTRFLYGAPISVMNINKNSVCFRVVPSKVKNQKPVIIYDKGQPFYPIQNSASSSQCSDSTHMERSDLSFEKKISVKGCVPYKTKSFKVCLPVKEHHFKEYIRKCIHTALKNSGIQFSGKIIFQRGSQKKTTLIACHQSEPLSEILKEGMKKSDNTIMESLMIPAKIKNPSQFRKASGFEKYVIDVLEKGLGVDLSKARLTDGSGLSHHSLISPRHLAMLLLEALRHKVWGGIWLRSMSIGGKDGTLEFRLKDLPKNIKVFAKTGTLTGTNNLAGYILKNEKPRYLFVIMMQNFSESPDNYKALQGRIIRYLSHLVS